jgi:hypothetical protein
MLHDIEQHAHARHALVTCGAQSLFRAGLLLHFDRLINVLLN